MQEIQDLQLQYWELYKDVHGIKPRWVDFSSPVWQDVSYLQEAVARLEVELAQVMQEETIRQQEMVLQFEQDVAQLRLAGAKDDATAVRWLMEAEGYEPHEKELFCYNWGLPYNYLSNCEE